MKHLAVWLLLAAALPGSVDRNFGDRGRVVARVGAPVFAAATAPAPGAGVYVAAYTGSRGLDVVGGDLVVLRYDRGGRRVRGFGGNGLMKITLPEGPATVGAMAVQPDGHILLAGSVGTAQDALVARLTRRGRLDPSFAGDGVQATDFGTDFEGATGLAVAPDGSIVLAGSTGTRLPGSGQSSGFAARYRPDGSLDDGFGTGGRVRMEGPLAGSGDGGYLDFQDVAVTDDGGILLAGNSGVGRLDEQQATLALLRPDGSPDPRVPGLARRGPSGGIVHDMVLDRRRGRVYLVGGVLTARGGNDVLAIALRRDLSPARAFGAVGVSQLAVPGSSSAFATSGALDPNGRLVLGGSALASRSGPQRGFSSILRLTRSGRVDRPFGRRGRVLGRPARRWLIPEALLGRPRGRMLVVSNQALRGIYHETGRAIALRRYRLGG